jgi:hypothetical protein
MLTKRDNLDVNRAALASFMRNGKLAVKELSTVPECRICGRVPKMYARFDDGTVQCVADAARDCA